MKLSRRFFAALAPVSAAALLVSTLTPLSPAAAADPAARAVDGKTQHTAAASCWEIKQKDPTAASGAYWLVTPAMDAPQQFYCDQTTDGGGWVMIGQGREGWAENYEGQGDPDSLATTAPGPAAFRPVQLASRTVDGLLDGARPDELTDGLRIHRAKDQAGTQWQEVRLDTTNQPRWSWTLSAKIPVTSASFDGSKVSNQMTNLAQVSGDRVKTLRFTDRKEQGYLRGFAYGDGVAGTTAADSYLWAQNSTTGAIAFSQVFVRPQVSQEDFAGQDFPASGTEARQQRWLPDSGAEPTTWGGVGRADGRSGELNTEVQAFAENSGSVFTGGNFARMQRDGTGTGAVDQKYLAAFDVATGQLRQDFRPVLDGQVKALAVLPGNRWAVGGLFTTVNGVSSPGLAVLDPTTGALDPQWKLKIENLISGGVLQVRGLSVRGDDLYIAGAFTHLTGGTDPNPVYARGAAKVNATNGMPDRAWNPNFNGTAVGIDASAQGDRVYAAGYFSQSGPDPAFRLAALAASGSAATTPWAWTPSTSPRPGPYAYQFAVLEHGQRVWAGGAEHSLFGYNRDTLERTNQNITEAGGDFQSLSGNDSTIFGSCHCGHHNYSGASQWRVPRAAFTQADRIDLIGAWDAEGGGYLPEFNPRLKGQGGWGVWASMVDSRGVLWAGGDLVRSETGAGRNQWSGGFVRFAPRDSTAPATPTGVTATRQDRDGTEIDEVSWKAVAEPGVVYHVLSGDRVVATTTKTSVSVPSVEGAGYAVRAADASGNLSASTAFTEPSAAPAASYSVLDAGAAWRYRYAAAAPPAGWNSVDFDASEWSEGAAALGRGTSGLGTVLTTPSPAPRSFQVRRDIQIEDASALSSLTLTTRADDGVVVYVNGTEVTRSNLPSGAINHSTYATAAPRTATATANPVTVEVPGWLLRDGKNVVSAQVHANWAATPDLSFELTAVAHPGEATPPPADPPANQALVPAGATWSVRHVNSAPPGSWFGSPPDPAWPQLRAPVGWGGRVSSVLPANGTRPVTTQLVREFDVADPESLHEVLLTTRADDGVVVWINGEEVVRKNVPVGSASWNTYATQAPRTAAATADPVTAVVPASALTEGKNTVAVQMHANYRSTPDASADLSLQVVPEEAAEARMAEDAGEARR